MALPKVHRLPPGYRKASVIFTDAEWERVKRSAALQPHGTYSEAIRRAMGLLPNPYRFAARLREQAELEKRIYPQPEEGE